MACFCSANRSGGPAPPGTGNFSITAMGHKANRGLPPKYNRGGLFGHKPVVPAAGNTSETDIAHDVEPGVDDAGPTAGLKKKSGTGMHGVYCRAKII